MCTKILNLIFLSYSVMCLTVYFHAFAICCNPSHLHVLYCFCHHTFCSSSSLAYSTNIGTLCSCRYSFWVRSCRKIRKPKKVLQKLQESDDPKAYKNIIQILRADFFFCSSYEGRRTFNAMEIQIHCTTTQFPGK